MSAHAQVDQPSDFAVVVGAQENAGVYYKNIMWRFQPPLPQCENCVSAQNLRQTILRTLNQ